MAKKYSLDRISIYGDSRFIIDWAGEKTKISSRNLVNCLVRIENLKESFACISFQHVFRELSSMADGMSKKGLGETSGFLHYSLKYDGRVQDEGVMPLC